MRHVNYWRRKVDTGYDRAPLRTIRGVGYQTGGTVARSATASSSSAGALQPTH
ncbi:MAG TPA: helix-turn-helix domain-containing protein [Candidatus Eisenbacteria bacterium]|nr:helix-turn-helix domain-containing protein [Candidatus Eisenbacteria bacterium]